ncbi:MAG: type II 3-dehydroquinate dehydratase [Rhodospirillaceae bacterium]|nr:type II 3-dehydroquinate dehydratase [Rhodospirillaceae bacterium]|tara:strand:- start:2399 stop:2848 length:450 start_codon:yes stop_codon:yes gene_type:complete
MPNVIILNGPNLNLLGTREPEIYGRDTLSDIEEKCRFHAEKTGLSIDFRQSNNEGDLVTWIQEAASRSDGIIINPAAYTHTSVAILDALKQVDCPIIEIHLSNIFSREEFRHHSFVSPVAKGVICGFGAQGYLLALDAISSVISDKEEG